MKRTAPTVADILARHHLDTQTAVRRAELWKHRCYEIDASIDVVEQHGARRQRYGALAGMIACYGLTVVPESILAAASFVLCGVIIYLLPYLLPLRVRRAAFPRVSSLTSSTNAGVGACEASTT